MNENFMWLTANMRNAGLTELVIKYLTGNILKLPKTISWPEFFYLWALNPKKFRKTEVFKEKFAAFINSKEIHPDKKIVFLNDIAQEKTYKELLLDYLPFDLLLGMDLNFWDVYHGRNRARTKAEKKLFIDRLRGFVGKIVFSENELVGYFQASKGFPEHRAIARALIQSAIPGKRISLYNLKNCQGYDINDDDVEIFIGSKTLGEDKLFDLFKITCSRKVIKAIQEQLGSLPVGDSSIPHTFNSIKETLKYLNSDKAKVVFASPREEFLPIVKLLVDKSTNEQLERVNLLEFLPRYTGPDNMLVNGIVNRVRTMMRENRQPGCEIQHEEFKAWYSYSHEDAWIELCIKAIQAKDSNSYTWWDLGYAVEVYELCNDERIILTAISSVLARDSGGHTEMVLKFCLWITTKHPEWWNLVQQTIAENKRMELWFSEYSNSKVDKHYLELVRLLAA